MVKIAKEFYWEMGHRLPKHDGLCRNLHGHSYKMRIEISGELNENQMVIDYFDLSQIAKKIIEPFDHAFLCESDDILMLSFLQSNNFKHVAVPFISTAENICSYFLDKFKVELNRLKNIHNIAIRIYETEDVYAETTCFF